MNFSSSFDKRYSIANGSIIQKVAFILAVKGQFRGADGRAEDWNYQATLLWAQGERWPRIVPKDGTEELKIVCQPGYDDSRPTSTVEPSYKLYDLLPIPCRKEGVLQFETLSLTIHRVSLFKARQTQRSKELGGVTFDLWVPPGNHCLISGTVWKRLSAKSSQRSQTH